eukprot:comp11600_c0_seq1/m.6086 comp11600_c0_seq1/g.6086  ORF comp11600_c0_seq1/g.6086 comp11600_c0_seq1/m.6086 type:complete len:146 (-) comp11600_c0_seq1:27-464(-)
MNRHRRSPSLFVTEEHFSFNNMDGVKGEPLSPRHGSPKLGTPPESPKVKPRLTKRSLEPRVESLHYENQDGHFVIPCHVADTTPPADGKQLRFLLDEKVNTVASDKDAKDARKGTWEAATPDEVISNELQELEELRRQFLELDKK